MRLVPPDRFQADAITDVIKYFNWTYFSLIYTEGSYGENAARFVEKQAKFKNICIGYSRKIVSDANEEYMGGVLKDLYKNKNARVVVVILESLHIRYFFSMVYKSGYNGHFIFIGSDSMAFSGHLGPGAAGSLSLQFTFKENPDFMMVTMEYMYFLKLCTH